MVYRELLERCRKVPGWLGSRDQKNSDSMLKYRAWVEKQNEEFEEKKRET
jgi:hypothetical protein